MKLAFCQLELLPLKWLHKHIKTHHLLDNLRFTRSENPSILALTIVFPCLLIRYSTKTGFGRPENGHQNLRRSFPPWQRNLFHAKFSLPHTRVVIAPVSEQLAISSSRMRNGRFTTENCYIHSFAYSLSLRPKPARAAYWVYGGLRD